MRFLSSPRAKRVPQPRLAGRWGGRPKNTNSLSGSRNEWIPLIRPPDTSITCRAQTACPPAGSDLYWAYAAQPLQGTVDRGHTRVQQLSHLGRPPSEHLTQDQSYPLAGWEVLEGGDERQANAVAGGRKLGRIGAIPQDQRVGDGRHPDPVGQHFLQRCDHWWERRPHIHGECPALAPPEHVQADVGRDAVQPRPHAGAPLEALSRPPSPQHRLLDRILGVEARADHPVAVPPELAPVSSEILGSNRRWSQGHDPRIPIKAARAMSPTGSWAN
jgi:hypothetical protein